MIKIQPPFFQNYFFVTKSWLIMVAQMNIHKEGTMDN